MRCFECGSGDHYVRGSRQHDGQSIRRRRVCVRCGYRWTTYETRTDDDYEDIIRRIRALLASADPPVTPRQPPEGSR